LKGFNIFYLEKMKLSEYFQWHKSQSMHSNIKNQIFSRIQKEKTLWMQVNLKLPTKTFFFVSRKIIYGSLATLLILVIFWWLMLDKNDIIDFWSFSVEKHKNLNGVFADYVAEVIEFNWEYSLVRNWSDISNLHELKMIEWWDTVILKEWTDLIFSLSDGAQAKILWPAEFSIIKWKKWYKISIVDWKFFRIYSQNSQSEIDISTPELSIHQDKNQVLDLHIAKENNGDVLVKNVWDDVKLISKKNSKEETILKEKDLVSINQNTDTIDILKDSDLMLTFMDKNDISATFTLSSDKVEWPKIESKDHLKDKIVKKEIGEGSTVEADKEAISERKVTEEQNDSLLEWIIEVISSDTVVTWDLNTTISSELWINTDKQQVPNQTQMKILTTNLNTFFLMNTFEGIYNNRSQQDISKFADRINSISSSFWYTDRASSNLPSIKTTIIGLKNKLENDRYISPSYILQMEKVANWCDELNNPSKQDWDTLISWLPEVLKLK